MRILTKIKNAVKKASDILNEYEYLEKNYRTLLANILRDKDLEVHEEVIVAYVVESISNIPIGYGHCDIVVVHNKKAIILELKISKKNCELQLRKYIKHWDYCDVLCGYCINFFIGGYTISKHESII